MNKKRHSIKLDFKYSKLKVGFLETLLYSYHSNYFQTALSKKPADYQNYLHAKIYTSSITRKGIPFIQELAIAGLCSIFNEYKKHSNNMVKPFVEKGTQNTSSAPYSQK